MVVEQPTRTSNIGKAALVISLAGLGCAIAALMAFDASASQLAPVLQWGAYLFGGGGTLAAVASLALERRWRIGIVALCAGVAGALLSVVLWYVVIAFVAALVIAMLAES